MKREVGDDLVILSGNANRPLAESIAGSLGLFLGEVDVGRFIDGETRVKINSQVRDKDVFVVQPTCNSPEVPASPNDNLAELCIMVDALKRAAAERVTAVLPYYGYARQDRKDQPRVPITAKWVADALVSSGVDRLLTFDLHAEQIQGFFGPRTIVDHVQAAPRIFLPHIRAEGLEEAVVGCADIGGVKLMQKYADRLHTSTAVVTKERLNDREVAVTTVLGEVANRNVILVDDIVSTAGTLCAAAESLVKRGAEKIYAAVTHGVLCGPALKRLRVAPIEELWITDSVPHAPDSLPASIRILTAAPLLAKAIAHIHNGESVSELYQEAQASSM